MANKLGVSQSTVSRVGAPSGLQPHRVETFKLSTDPLFIDKVRDIVGLYLNPPDQGDGAVRGREEPDSGLGSNPAAVAAGAGLAGAAHARLQASRHDQPVCGAGFGHRTGASASCIGAIAARSSSRSCVPSKPTSRPSSTVHLILDNYGTHKTPSVKAWFARHPRFRLHFTPTSSSWLNLVERFFALHNRTPDQARNSSQHSVNWNAPSANTSNIYNEDPNPFIWTKTADRHLRELRQNLCQRISDSGH